ncbi:glycoside hydrolase [Cytidiella melzeri]|nr:glycoside hydrolase [Cytidiella melzeri]
MSIQNMSRHASYRHVGIVVLVSALLLTFYHFSGRRNSTTTLFDESSHSERPLPPPQPPPLPPHAPPPRPPPTATEDTVSIVPKVEWARRAHLVKEAFLHAYHGYETYAAPHDELLPVTGGSVDNFNGWSVTMYDSLSTILLMGLHDEFERALPAIENISFTLKHPVIGAPVYAPFFETVIRHLGGLLSAYALSYEPVLLKAADALAVKLAPVFNTTSGLPAFGVDPDFGASSITIRHLAVAAEVGSCQLEYAYLSRLTGKKEHYDRTAAIMKALSEVDLSSVGMFAQDFDLNTGQHFAGHISVGAASDSLHEYLLKLYLLTGQKDQVSLDLYVKTVNRILTTLLYVSSNRGLLYVTDAIHADKSEPIPTHKFEHLSCFLPGLIALGVHSLPDRAFDNAQPKGMTAEDEQEILQYDWKELHMTAAKGLAEACYQMYEDQPSGLGPEEVQFHQDGKLWIREMRKWRAGGKRGKPPGVAPKKKTDVKREDYSLRKWRYLLRPETLESIFLLWKTTGDGVWRERGWAIFQALEKHTKTGFGYSTVHNVVQLPVTLDDEMPSYFLAETLKYLYLLFSDEDLVPLDSWVFNTEAHPLPIFDWSSWERSKFNIPYES